MIQLTDALFARITGDSLISAVGAGLSTTVIQLGAGVAASYPPGTVVSFTGSGATAANDKKVRTVKARDLVLDTITVAALPVAPAAGNQVKAGCREWLVSSLAGGVGVYEWGWDPSPVEELLKLGPTERRAILMFGAPSNRPGMFALNRISAEYDAYGHDLEWLEGLTSRLKSILHARPANLTIEGHKAHELLVDAANLPLRRDALKGAAILLRASVAPAVG